MRINRKIKSLVITAIIISLIVGLAIARTSDFDDFSGEGHSSCHGNITQSTSGYVSISSSSGTSINPGEIFTVSIQVISFTEAQGIDIAVGFPSGSPGRGNNKDFTFDATQKSTSIDGSGNSIVINFQVTAPSTEQSYTLHADAIYRAGGSSSYFAHGDFILTVEIQNTPPQFNNIIESADPLELGQEETFNVDVTDSETSVNTVLIELESTNYTMSNTVGNTYEYNWTPSISGSKDYIIYAEDTEGSWNSISGSINVIDTTIPILSNLVESADPLELGQTETIQINTTDLSGISQVLIEIETVNYTMTNILETIWEYNSWTPTSTGLKLYSIYASDTEGNWNSISNDITVRDTIAPTYNYLIESADPLPLGQNVTISIEVYDSPGSGVKNVFLNYDDINHTMNFIGFNTWKWSNWKPTSAGTFNYSIYMVDNWDNINNTIGTIEVIISSGPTIQNLSKSSNPLELGLSETIQIDINDTDGVSNAFIEIGAFNYTMTNVGGNKFEYTWKPNTTGTILFKIYANDSLNNWNHISDSIFVQDTTPPNFENLTENSDPLELGNIVIISIDAIDLSGINQVFIEIEGVNHSMSYVGGDTWFNNTWVPDSVNIYLYTIFIQDNSNNWNTTTGSIEVIDTTIPILSNIVESADPLELGQTEIIKINATDLSGISQVLIEITSINYTMTNIGGSTWEYNSWTPTSTGLKIYTIYANDTSNNQISLIGNISVVDTSGPIFSNLVMSNEPIFLGQTLLIQVDVTDLSSVSDVLIEFEGSNHTMTNTAGNTWEFSDWIPSSTGEILFTIHAKDINNNWNSIVENILVLEQSAKLDLITIKEITDLAFQFSIYGIIIAGIVLIIKTIRNKRFIK